MAKLAQIWLDGPETPVTSERLWSAAGNIVFPNRERLDSSRGTNMLYAQAALIIRSSLLPSLHEFSKKDDDTGE